MTTITLQFSSHTDEITPDGQELTRKPYPYHVDAATGRIQRQDFWQGRVFRVIGFVVDPGRMEIDLWWPDVATHPQRAVGMYVVVADDNGRWSTNVAAIMTVTSVPDRGLDPDAALERARTLISRIESLASAAGLAQAAGDLAEVVQALDNHLTEGGFPPEAWMRD
jgi:hypothetical protein